MQSPKTYAFGARFLPLSHFGWYTGQISPRQIKTHVDLWTQCRAWTEAHHPLFLKRGHCRSGKWHRDTRTWRFALRLFCWAESRPARGLHNGWETLSVSVAGTIRHDRLGGPLSLGLIKLLSYADSNKSLSWG